MILGLVDHCVEFFLDQRSNDADAGSVGEANDRRVCFWRQFECALVYSTRKRATCFSELDNTRF